MTDEAELKDYSNKYSEESFWQKLRKYVLIAGKKVIEIALILYYCLKDMDTPKSAKAVIGAALGYFIWPLDAIPDFVPVVGYSDDLGALVLALTTVAVHIKPEHRRQAKEKLREWFGEEDEGPEAPGPGVLGSGAGGPGPIRDGGPGDSAVGRSE